MKTRRRPLMPRSMRNLLLGTLVTQPMAWAEVPIAQFPAGTGVKLPAPNVIVSVDDSGSMGDAGIATLKAALQDTFSVANLEDGQIRLAWQSMNKCFGIPSNSAACGNNNVLKVFKGQHRTHFLNWVQALSPGGGTPAHRLVRGAGDYLSRTGLGMHSPWAYEPGTQEAPLLSCRKSYHLFMTDGGWNSSAAMQHDAIDGDRTRAGYRSDELIAPHGNIDGSARTLGDGSAYQPFTDQTRIYADPWGYSGPTGLNTLADLAFYYWATDLQPDMPNHVKPTFKADDRTFANASGSVRLNKTWNPENDPATWQHLVTYSIGFGAGATGWSGHPIWDGGTHQGSGYEKLILGQNEWPSPLCASNTACDGASAYASRDNERKAELWHMALNGRGLFVPAPTAASLGPAFQRVLNEIIVDNSTPTTSVTSASMSVARAGTRSFAAGYTAHRWSGAITANSLAQGSGAATASWGGQSTADKLDALPNVDDRLILSWREGGTGAATDGATAFRWADDTSRLSAVQKNQLKTPHGTDAEGSARLGYLRGERGRESSGGPLFRKRDSRQGDIVNSQVWYAAQPVSNHSFEGYAAFAQSHKDRLPLLYAGGNDGMLHGFSAEDGSEKIAYVPKGVIPELYRLTQPSYDANHRYFVDGSPFTGDVNWGSGASPNWRTLLVGTLGAGGKGYFVLDVTTPGNKTGAAATPASNFQEASAASLVVMDRTTPTGSVTTSVDAAGAPTPDTTSAAAHIGQITAAPVRDDTNPYVATQITRLNNGKWAVILGNGYNSSADRPALLIQYLDGSDRTLEHIAVTDSSATGGGNGLSAPRLVDLDGDGKTDVVYAGDLKGNLWKFDLLGSDRMRWHVAFGGAPLYTATHTASGSAAASGQPISAPPVVRANTRGGTGLMVAFGTGRNLTVGDRSSTAPQTLYSVLDGTTYAYPVDGSGQKGALAVKKAGTPVGTGVADLVAQTVTATQTQDSRTYSTLSANDAAYDGPGAKKGWYLHLPASGERLLEPMSFYDGTHILEVVTVIPAGGSEDAGETCDPQSRPPRYFRTFINIMDGKRPTFPVVDVDGNGYFNSTDLNMSRLSLSGPPGLKLDNACSKVEGCPFKVNKRGPDEHAQAPILPLRPNWRHLQ